MASSVGVANIQPFEISPFENEAEFLISADTWASFLGASMEEWRIEQGDTAKVFDGEVIS